MITEKKDKRTFIDYVGHCQSCRKGGSIHALGDYIKGRREKKPGSVLKMRMYIWMQESNFNHPETF